MGLFDAIGNLFHSEPETNLPIQVADDLSTFVEEKRAPRMTERARRMNLGPRADDSMVDDV